MLRQRLRHCWLGSLPFQHLFPLQLHGVEHLHLAERLPAPFSDLHLLLLTFSAVKVDWPSLPFCARSACSKTCPSLCFMRDRDSFSACWRIPPHCQSLPRVQLGHHVLVEADVVAVLPVELFIKAPHMLAWNGLHHQTSNRSP